MADINCSPHAARKDEFCLQGLEIDPMTDNIRLIAFELEMIALMKVLEKYRKIEISSIFQNSRQSGKPSRILPMFHQSKIE